MTIGSIASSAYSSQLYSLANRSSSATDSSSSKVDAPKGPPPQEMFRSVDEDSSGSLSQTEFASLLEKISGATGANLNADEIFSNYDEDGDGALSEDETMAALEANRPEGPPPPAEETTGSLEEELFSNADSDSNGTIDDSEAESLVDMINSATGQSLSVEDLISAFDEDEDGVLSEDETVAALEANRPQGPPPQENSFEALSGLNSYLQNSTDSLYSLLETSSSTINTAA